MYHSYDSECISSCFTSERYMLKLRQYSVEYMHNFIERKSCVSDECTGTELAVNERNKQLECAVVVLSRVEFCLTSDQQLHHLQFPSSG